MTTHSQCCYDAIADNAGYHDLAYACALASLGPGLVVVGSDRASASSVAYHLSRINRSTGAPYAFFQWENGQPELHQDPQAPINGRPVLLVHDGLDRDNWPQIRAMIEAIKASSGSIIALGVKRYVAGKDDGSRFDGIPIVVARE